MIDKKIGTLKKISGLALIIFLINACVPALKDVKRSNPSDIKDKTGAAAQPNKPDENPTNPKSTAQNSKPPNLQKDLQKSEPPDKLKAPASKALKGDKDLSDEEKVKNASLELVKKLESPKKYIICHDELKDEWSLTVFDDIGHVLDIKQYFWNMEKEKMEPFLVLDRIPKSRLKDELSRKSLGKKCSTYQP